MYIYVLCTGAGGPTEAGYDGQAQRKYLYLHNCLRQFFACPLHVHCKLVTEIITHE